MMEEVHVIAHRGGSQLRTENTMTAFLNAQKIGSDAIELDVHLTRDNRLAVFHDYDLERLANDERYVADLTYEELHSLVLPGDEHIPDLETVLEKVGITVVVEVKTRKATKYLAQIFREHPEYIEKCWVISFFHDVIKALKEEFPGLIAGPLLSGFPVNPKVVAEMCHADFLSLDFDGIEPEYVELCHRNGLPVNVWTVNKERDIRRVIAAGVDSITSDRPDLVIAALKRGT